MSAAAVFHTPEGVRGAQAIGILVAVISLPLALGGVLPEARASLVLGAAMLVALEWVPRSLRGGGPDSRGRAWLWVWGMVVALIGLQLLPLPASLISHLGAEPAGFHELSDVRLGRLTPTPSQTLHYGAMFTAYWTIAWMVSTLHYRHARWVIAALVGIACFEALYGTHALVHGRDSILGLWPRASHLDDATGTYANRNHFAGLLALSWPVGLAWIASSRTGRSRRRLEPLRLGAAALFSLLLAIALVASHSRMGVLAAMGGLLTWLVASRDRRVRPTGATGRWLLWSVPALALLGTIWFGSDRMIERFFELPAHQERLLAWRALFELPARTWVLGAGAGAFSDVFKTVQPPALVTSMAYAHSDWLELFVDFGVLGVAGITAAVGLWWCRVRPRTFGALQLGALGGITAIAIHSLADFNLHIPGTALAFWVLVGITANPRMSRRSGHESLR